MSWIPKQCPKGCRPVRLTPGMSTTTAMYFPPIYDEHGRNINPDRNTTTTEWHCGVCGHAWTVAYTASNTMGPSLDDLLIHPIDLKGKGQ